MCRGGTRLRRRGEGSGRDLSREKEKEGAIRHDSERNFQEIIMKWTNIEQHKGGHQLGVFGV